MRLKREPDLYNAPAEHNETNSANQSENERGQVVDGRDRIACRKCCHAAEQRKAQNNSSIQAEALDELLFCEFSVSMIQAFKPVNNCSKLCD